MLRRDAPHASERGRLKRQDLPTIIPHDSKTERRVQLSIPPSSLFRNLIAILMLEQWMDYLLSHHE
jgi:hypothetical protein